MEPIEKSGTGGLLWRRNSIQRGTGDKTRRVKTTPEKRKWSTLGNNAKRSSMIRNGNVHRICKWRSLTTLARGKWVKKRWESGHRIKKSFKKQQRYEGVCQVKEGVLPLRWGHVTLCWLLLGRSLSCTVDGGLQTPDAWVPTSESDLIDLDFGQVQEDFSKVPQVILTCSENHC